MPKNNLPLYFEELKLKEEATLSLHDLITQFKQQIPVNFVYLEINAQNYQCSTTGWKEPVCERYGFTYQNQWIQLDIPHSLLAKLGLKKGEDLPSAFYLVPHLLKKEVETTQGGITLQEGEIILVNPHKITLKDQAIQTDLSRDGIKELENTIAKQSEQIQAKDQELAGLRNQLSLWTTTFSNESANQVQTRINSLNSQLTQKDTQINTLQTNYNNANNRANNLQTQLNTANAELVREKGWWDKWKNDPQWSDSAVVSCQSNITPHVLNSICVRNDNENELKIKLRFLPGKLPSSIMSGPEVKRYVIDFLNFSVRQKYCE